MGLFGSRFQPDGDMRVRCKGAGSGTPIAPEKHTPAPATSGERVSANTPEPTAHLSAGELTLPSQPAPEK